MARKRQRFSSLLNKLRGTEGSATSGPVGEFQKWLTGINKINVERPLNGKERAPVYVSVVPFTEDVATVEADSYVKTRMSTYSYQGWSSRIGASNLPAINLGWKAPTNAHRSAKDLDFYPALLKVVFSRIGSTTAAPTISGITKQSYNYLPTRTFALPFGRTVSGTADGETGSTNTNLDEVDYEEVKKGLAKTLNDGSTGNPPAIVGLKRFSFEPEVNRGADSKAQLFGGTIGSEGVSVG